MPLILNEYPAYQTSHTAKYSCTMSVKLHGRRVSMFQSPAITRTSCDTVEIRPHSSPSVSLSCSLAASER